MGRVAEIVTDYVLPIAHTEDLNLIDVEFIKEGSDWILRIFLENQAGDLTIEECEKVSRALSAVLDEEDPIDKSYILEVSSPGLERPLKTEADFERFQGELIAVTTYAKIKGEKEFVGILEAYQNNEILLKLKTDKTVKIKKDLIARANLTFEI
ncbi:ribosome maturation factor RimP [Halanaerobium salsuginis]|uniref:Ribosome maturation factor RimP n=1 Tax=Halanaerobium salsuginis TaxID=29563 RepID=A0A1I4FA54_9FIRM|nr:ribosome maturation factor RimP [Halanaerobium salsuginis]